VTSVSMVSIYGVLLHHCKQSFISMYLKSMGDEVPQFDTS
jgi:hypothetical protein